jgi:hypothetical protein
LQTVTNALFTGTAERKTMRVFWAKNDKVVPNLPVKHGDPYFVPVGKVDQGFRGGKVRISPEAASLIRHPGKNCEYLHIINAGLEINPLSPRGGYRITFPQPGDERKALVRWSFSSGIHGRAEIILNERRPFAVWGSYTYESIRHAELMLVLEPGEEVRAWRDGVSEDKVRAILSYDGQKVRITLGPSGLWSDQ